MFHYHSHHIIINQTYFKNDIMYSSLRYADRSVVTFLPSTRNLPFSYIELLAEAHSDSTLDTLHKDIPNRVPDCRLKCIGVQMCPVSHCDDV